MTLIHGVFSSDREGYPIFVVVLGIVSLVSGFPTSRDLIPNGRNVPSPCDPSQIWDGVGHLNQAGGGPRNPFGLDFAANGKKWDATLCQKDSDGDGRTNGVELGDPGCIWTVGDTATQTEGISHPGICEPIDSTSCSVYSVTCPEPFDCPAIEAQDTFSIDINLPETTVPDQKTTYKCMNFELPNDREYHIVAATPLIDNKDVMHHIVAYECEADSEASLKNPLDTPYNCNMAPEAKCNRMIAVWYLGVDGNCFNENAGFLVGGNNGFKYAAFQLHWNNPDLLDSYTDSSGMSFHMTPILRPNNAGIMLIGQRNLAIPPEEEKHEATGSCTPACTNTYLKDRIYITSAANHMHLLGRAQTTERLRDGEPVKYLAKDNAFNYNTPKIYDHAPSIEVRLGDEIKTTCEYNSVGVSSTTNFGSATSDEMCFAFLFYYPKENLNTSTCVQPKKDGECVECDFEEILNLQNMASYYSDVSTKCSVDMCTEDCLNYVRDKKQEACFKGTNYETIKKRLWELPNDSSLRMKALEFLLLMDSCDRQLYRDIA